MRLVLNPRCPTRVVNQEKRAWHEMRRNVLTSMIKKAVLAGALGATALAVASPAEAQRYRHYRHHDDTGAAVFAGVAGLAIGAALASDSRYDYDRRYYRQHGYYPTDGYYYR